MCVLLRADSKSPTKEWCGDLEKKTVDEFQKGSEMNRSLITILIIVIACCTLVVAFGGTKEAGGVSSQSPQAGRFILESGEYVAPSVSAVQRLPGIFKIDTTTGKVWRYDSEVVGGKAVEKWIPISE